MKKIFSYITFTFLTLFAATISLPVIAGGCSSHKNKAVELKCDKDDTECQTEKVKNSFLKEAIKS